MTDFGHTFFYLKRTRQGVQVTNMQPDPDEWVGGQRYADFHQAADAARRWDLQREAQRRLVAASIWLAVSIALAVATVAFLIQGG